MCECVDSGPACASLFPALAGSDEAGERKPAEWDPALAHAPQHAKRRGVAAAPDAAGDGGVPGRRGPVVVRHCVEQVERGVRGGPTPAEVEGEEGVAMEGAERQRAAEDEPVDGAREERGVGEVGEAGARELGDGRVRVTGQEEAEGLRRMGWRWA